MAVDVLELLDPVDEVAGLLELHADAARLPRVDVRLPAGRVMWIVPKAIATTAIAVSPSTSRPEPAAGHACSWSSTFPTKSSSCSRVPSFT